MANKKYGKGKSYVRYGSVQKYKKNSAVNKGYIIFAVFVIIMIAVGALSSCERVKHVEALEGYTMTQEQLVEQADLVLIEGYYAGIGKLNGIDHLRFQAQKDGQITDTIDVTSKFYKIIYTDEPSLTDKNLSSMNGKVKAYVRTYKKDDDVKTHNYYEVYADKDKINNIGKLDSGE